MKAVAPILSIRGRDQGAASSSASTRRSLFKHPSASWVASLFGNCGGATNSYPAAMVLLGASKVASWKRNEFPVAMLPFPIAEAGSASQARATHSRPSAGQGKLNLRFVENHQCVVGQCLGDVGHFQLLSPVGTDPRHGGKPNGSRTAGIALAVQADARRPVSTTATMQDKIGTKFQAEWMQAYGSSAQRGLPCCPGSRGQ